MRMIIQCHNREIFIGLFQHSLLTLYKTFLKIDDYGSDISKSRCNLFTKTVSVALRTLNNIGS